MKAAFICIALLVCCLAVTFVAAAKPFALDDNNLIQQFTKVTKNAYNFEQQEFSNIDLYSKQQQLNTLLGLTGNFVSQNKKLCPKLNEYFSTTIINKIDYFHTNHLQQFEVNAMLTDILAFNNLIDMYQCKELNLAKANHVYQKFVVHLLLQDTLFDIYVGVKLATTMIDLGYTAEMKSTNVDWVDLIDLLNTLLLDADGFGRGSVSTINASPQHTLYIAEIIYTVLSKGYATPAQIKTDKILQALEKLKPLTCIYSYKTKALTSFGATDLNSYFTLYAQLANLLNKKDIGVNLQCATNIIAQPLFALNIAAMNSAEFVNIALPIITFFTKTLETVVNAEVFKIQDNIDSKGLYIYTNSATTIDFTADGAKFDVYAVSNIGPTFAGFAKTQNNKNQKLIAALANAKTDGYVATLQPTINTRISKEKGVSVTPSPITATFSAQDLIQNKVIKFNKVDIKKFPYGQYTFSLTNPAKIAVFETRVAYVANTQAVKPSTDAEITYVVNYVLHNTPQDAKKAAKSLTTKNQLKLDLSTDQQITFYNSDANTQQTIKTIRFVACPTDNLKDCQNLNIAKVPAAQQYSVYFGYDPINTETGKSSAMLFLTTKEVSGFFKNTPTSTFAIVYDVVSMQEYTTASRIVAYATVTGEVPVLTKKNEPDVGDVYGDGIQRFVNKSSNYLWELIEHHYHTFNKQQPLANPVLTITFIGALLVATLFCLGYFLIKYRPSLAPGGFVGFLLSNVFMGMYIVALLMILAYWFRYNLFDMMLPIAIFSIPFAIVMRVTLRESVTSLRLYRWLYETKPDYVKQQQQQQNTIKQKKD